MNNAAWKALIQSIPIGEIRLALREAINACSERGLDVSSLWASEALNSLSSANTKDAAVGRATTASGETKWSANLQLDQHYHPHSTFAKEVDVYSRAMSFFRRGEFDRASATLDRCASDKSMFLRLFSKYLTGERERRLDARLVFESRDYSSTVNKELDSIEAELSMEYFAGTLDSFCKYLYGVVLIKRQKMGLAAGVLVESVNQYPFNWSAWLDLASCIPSFSAAVTMVRDLPLNIMTAFMLCRVGITHSYRLENLLGMLDDLTEVFPKSSFLKAERATALFHGGDHPASIEIFGSLLKDYPYCLDRMDIYSNVLFMAGDLQRLSDLARKCYEIDRHRAETCCAIGNLFSLEGDHMRAVVWFKKALRVGYSAAWTMLGHEYLEMKRASQAIEAYRRAVDYNRNDYRAWNGLGQAYEVLKMYPGALENYQRAARLRPYDGQIRCAMAESYESMGRDTDAIKCFERVLVLSGQDMVAIIKLPKLYKKIGDKMNAVRCFRRSLGYLHEYQADSEDTSEACLYLAEYERDGGNVVEASKYAKEALHSSSDRHREEARAMLQGFGHVSEPLLDRVHSCWSDFAAPEDRNR